MARDGLQMRLVGGARLDRVLASMAIDSQSAATKIVNQSLNKGAAEVRKEVKKTSPKEVGELKKSVKNRISRKTKSRSIFMAAVFFKFNRSGNEGTGGFHSHFIERGTKFIRPKNFTKKAVRNKRTSVKKIIGEQLASKIAAFNQKKINSLG